MTVLYNKPNLKHTRQKLRKDQTPAEKAVWHVVRNRQINNLKFFRQYSVGNYILDFYCPEIRLAVEIDGGQHNIPSEISADNKRSQYLADAGIQVLRFWNNDVLENLDGVHQRLTNAMEKFNSPNPS